MSHEPVFAKCSRDGKVLIPTVWVAIAQHILTQRTATDAAKCLAELVIQQSEVTGCL